MGQLKGILIGIILGALAAGGAAWWMVRQSAVQLAPTPIATVQAPSAGSTQTKPTPPPPAPPTVAPKVAPPWAQGDQPSAQMEQQELQALREKRQRLQKVLEAYQQLVREGKQSDPMAVSHLLDQLQAAAGSSVVNGIDLNVLRHNLKVAAQIKVIAQKLQTEAHSANPNKQKIQEYIDQLNQLKGGMNTNYLSKIPGMTPNAGSGDSSTTNPSNSPSQGAK